MLIIHHICVVDQFVEYSLQFFPPFCERKKFFSNLFIFPNQDSYVCSSKSFQTHWMIKFDTKSNVYPTLISNVSVN